MDDGVHVWAIDAHAERVGRAHDGQRAAGERVLHARALVVFQSRVVGARLDARRGETRRREFSRLARRRVDERAPSAHEPRKPAVLLVLVHALDAEMDVGPVESRDEQPRLFESEQRDDVVAHLGCRGRRERRHRRPFLTAVGGAAQRRGGAQPAVVGTEVVAPLRDAMRLVHDEARYGDPGEQPQEPL